MEFLRLLLRCHFAWKPVGWRREIKCRLFCALRPWDISLSGSILQLARVTKSDKKNTAFCLKYIYIYLADFFKTNLTKSAVIWVKSCQNAGFLRPISSKITPTKEKERRKSKSEERERRRREKNNGYTLSFYNGYFFWPKKKTVGRKRSIWR